MARQDANAIHSSPISRSVAYLRLKLISFLHHLEILFSLPACFSTGASFLGDTDKDFLVTRLIQKIEDLHTSTASVVPKKATSARGSIVHLAPEPTICCGLPDSAKVLRHHHNNQLRMLTHRWKRLGLHYPTRIRDDNTFEPSQGKSRAAVKTDCPLKITTIQTRHTEAPTVRKQDNKEQIKGSDISDAGIPAVKVCDIDTQSTPAVSLNSDDSDLSDQEKESFQVSKWAASMELDLKPEPFDKNMDLPCSAEIEIGQVYAEVLPAPLKDLDSTESPEGQQKLFTSDPCLAPMVARLLELERLQAATVQKERAKRSCPTTASTPTRNASHLRNSESPGSKLGISSTPEQL
ncbi:hypothetical protein NFI96_028623 [Prochilodus magdalenae]|nr:hypothetical protein NFI96_028623 [Prochilodus magdalenae]